MVILKKKKCVVLFSTLLLTGCVSKEGNFLQNVEERETIATERIEQETKQQENEMELLNGVDTQRIRYYIDDTHFYDGENEIEFRDQKHNLWKIKITDAYISDNLDNFGTYFVSRQDEMEEVMQYLIDTYGYQRKELTYLGAKITITNQEESIKECFVSDFDPWLRISDDSFVQYGLADKYIQPACIYSELWYDYYGQKAGKSYYCFDAQPGINNEMMLVWIIEKALVDKKELYMLLNMTQGNWDSKWKCQLPPTDEDTKFLKIRIREG